ncbi:hypothetical protein PROFUN_17106, partial [Planoprotostelium fungivorum]
GDTPCNPSGHFWLVICIQGARQLSEKNWDRDTIGRFWRETMPYNATHPNRGLLNGLIQQHRTNGYNTTFRGKAASRILNDTTVDDAEIDVWYADAQAANTDADWEGLRDAIVPPPTQGAPAGSSSHSGG